MAKEKIKNLTPEDITMWVLENQNMTEFMDKLNHLTYMYSSKFKRNFIDNGEQSPGY